MHYLDYFLVVLKNTEVYRYPLWSCIFFLVFSRWLILWTSKATLSVFSCLLFTRVSSPSILIRGLLWVSERHVQYILLDFSQVHHSGEADNFGSQGDEVKFM